ncbi:meckelin [Planoprotostelium fungivorum]|uniref:Meckelin n=1 Tax=Planoprotostelium fungivorum TaxID=1890364 RepID=A0A2P6MXG7_9EUKA|nr:meckelin [Planoprotostelium fungivorum]
MTRRSFLLCFSLTLCIYPLFVTSSTLTLPSPCNAGQYFDITSLTCMSCPSPKISSADGYSCQCPKNYTNSGSSCALCSEYQTRCLSCVVNITLGVQKDGYCGCPFNSRLVDGTTNQTCISCKDTEYPSTDRYSCTPCIDPSMRSVNNQLCACPNTTVLLGAHCVSSSDVTKYSQGTSDPYAITYNDVYNSNGGTSSSSISSSFLKDRFTYAASQCENNLDSASCEQLANMCVLNHYDKTTPACTVYNRIYQSISSQVNGEKDWKSALPWLLYSSDPTAQKLSSQYSFGNEIPFTIAQYAPNGTFLGITRLLSQFQECGRGNTPWNSFGTPYTHTCTIDLGQLIFRDDLTYFYDIYVLDNNNTLVPVPVLNLNMRQQGNLVNQGSSSYTYSRRLFIYDNVSGRQVNSATSEPSYIRYTSKIQFKVTTSPELGIIYVPIITISYYDQSTTSIQSAEPSNYNAYTPSPALPQVSYVVSYQLGDKSSAQSGLSGVLGAFLALGAVTGLYRILLWTRRNHSGRRLSALFRWIIYLLNSASTGIFVTVLAFSTAWMAMYKGQKGAILVGLPTSEIEGLLKNLIFAAAGCKIAVIFDLIWRQTETHIFFIDWEKSKGNLMSRGNEPTKSVPVSIWRTLFVANEWNEMQTMRKTSLPLTLLAQVFLLSGVGLIGFAGDVPSSPSMDRSSDPSSWMMSFGVGGSLFVAICYVQRFWSWLFVHRYIGHPLQQFIDVMSISNISAFIFSERCFGYYLHGRSVHAYSDTNMTELNENLKREEDDLTARRGLMPDTDTQVFEVYATEALREQYNHIFLYLLMQDIDARRERHEIVPLYRRNIRDVPDSKAVKAYIALKKFFTSFIDNNQVNHKYTVVEKSNLQKLTGYTPNLSRHNQTFLYEDQDGESYGDVMWWGHENQLMMMNVLVFGAAQSLGAVPIVAALAVWILEQMYNTLRNYWGEKNISQKTLVDRSPTPARYTQSFTMHKGTIALTIILLSTLLVEAADAKYGKVYLIRHGEKPADGGEGLSEAGKKRAQCLRKVFGVTSPYEIGYILAQQYKADGSRKRPYDTVKNLAADLGLEVDVSCDRDDADCVAHQIKKYHKQDNSKHVLVCWEHGRLTDIAQALDVDGKPEYPGERFDLIWTVKDGSIIDERSEGEGDTSSSNLLSSRKFRADDIDEFCALVKSRSIYREEVESVRLAGSPGLCLQTFLIRHLTSREAIATFQKLHFLDKGQLTGSAVRSRVGEGCLCK